MYNTPRKPGVALLLSLLMPGLGHLYGGNLIKAICLLIFFCLIPLLLARLTVALPSSFMVFGMLGSVLVILGIYLYGLVDSYRLAKQNGQSYLSKPYNTGFVYLAAWLVGFTCMVAADSYMKNNIVEAYRIVGSSMEPAVLKGDYVLADKTAYRDQQVRTGDVVIMVYPDDRSKVLIRSVVGLPGDEISLSPTKRLRVPHGHVFVRGSNREDVYDSDRFGAVDMRDIVGKVTQIYFSRAEDHIRWKRIGTLVNQQAIN